MKKSLLFILTLSLALVWSCNDDSAYPSLVSDTAEVYFFEPAAVKFFNEGAQGVGVVVSITESQTQPIVIGYTVEDITAVDGQHYEFISTKGEVVIPAGEAAGIILFNLLDDDINLGNRDFKLCITSVSSPEVVVTSGANGRLECVTVSINDNDCPPHPRTDLEGTGDNFISIPAFSFSTTWPATGILGSDCGEFSIESNFVASTWYQNLPMEVVLTPTGPTTGTASITEGTFCTDCGGNPGEVRFVDAVGTYDTAAKSINWNFDYYNPASGAVSWSGTNDITIN